MIKGLIFDFDGLIVDTETFWYESFKETIGEKYKVELELGGYSNSIGTSDDVLYQYFQKIIGKPVNGEQIRKDGYQKFLVKMIEPALREGVKEYLDEAKQNNLTIGLASSSSREWVEGYLDQLNIIDYFDVINTKDDVTRVKPDPELYRKTLNDCRLKPSEAIVFEDSFNGLKAAKQAGILCVIVPNHVTRNSIFEDYDYKLDSMKQETLTELLNNLKQYI
jgi:putative hydrolase of the HAD superfamily